MKCLVTSGSTTTNYLDKELHLITFNPIFGALPEITPGDQGISGLWEDGNTL